MNCTKDIVVVQNCKSKLNYKCIKINLDNFLMYSIIIVGTIAMLADFCIVKRFINIVEML